MVENKNSGIWNIGRKQWERKSPTSLLSFKNYENVRQSRTFGVSFCHWSAWIIIVSSLSKHTHALKSGQPTSSIAALGSRDFDKAGCPHISQAISLGIPDNQCLLCYCHCPRPLERMRPLIVATVV